MRQYLTPKRKSRLCNSRLLFSGNVRKRVSRGPANQQHRFSPRSDRYPCGFSGCKMPAMASPRHESESKQVFEAQLRATLDVIPAYTWYADPSGALTFVNKRLADYLGLPKTHPLRFAIPPAAPSPPHTPLLHPAN